MTELLMGLMGLAILILLGVAGAFIVWSVFSAALALRRRWLRYAVVGGFSVLLGGTVIVCVWGYVATRQLHNEIERIRRSGEPVLLEEIGGGVKAVDVGGEDAGRYYTAAIALQQRDRAVEHSEALGELRDAIREGRAASLDETQRRLLSGLLEMNAQALDLLDQADASDQCLEPVNADTNSYFLIDKGLSGPRHLANLAAYRATGLMAEGRFDEALDSIRMTVRTHRAVKADSLLGFLLKNAIVGMGAQHAGVIVQYETAAENLSNLSDELADAERQLSLGDALLGERALGLALMGVTPGAANPTAPLSNFPWPANRIIAVAYLRHLRDSIEAVRRPMPEVLGALREVEKGGLFGEMLHPSFVRAWIIAGRTHVTIRAARLAIACELYRRENGRPPGALAELVPDYIESIPPDPFDGKPIRYKVDGDALVFYSVGDNGVDDGGEIDTGKTDPPDWGLAVRLGAVRP